MSKIFNPQSWSPYRRNKRLGDYVLEGRKGFLFEKKVVSKVSGCLDQIQATGQLISLVDGQSRDIFRNASYLW